MKFIFSIFLSCIILTLFLLSGCSKTEYVDVLQDIYPAQASHTNPEGADFFVELQGKALQPGDIGEWEIVTGTVVDKFVYFENAKNPFSKFYGIPGEKYTLSYKITHYNKTTSSHEIDVRIRDIEISIDVASTSNFKTKILLFITPHYKGYWSFDKPHGLIKSNIHGGTYAPPEQRPSITFQGYENTEYTATYNYEYAGKKFTFHKKFITGEYQEDEALEDLGLRRDSYRVVTDSDGHVVELNLQGSEYTGRLEDLKTFPSFQSLKYLRKLNLGGSAIDVFPEVIGKYFLRLEDLDMDGVGAAMDIPENFGNLSKLKKFVFSPLWMVDRNRVLTLPKSFANLKALEYLIIKDGGFVEFNGTLEGLNSLHTLSAAVLTIPDHIGQLKKLTFLNMFTNDTYIPSTIGNCTALSILYLNFAPPSSPIVVPEEIGQLKKLETLKISAALLADFPESFGGLTSLKEFTIPTGNFKKIPESIGKLTNLEHVTLNCAIEAVPSSIGNLTKLKSVLIKGPFESLPESFGNLTELEYLNMDFSGLKTLPSSFGNLKKLEKISITHAQLSEIPDSFSGLDALHTAYLAQNKLTKFPDAIFGLKSLRTLYLNNNDIREISDMVFANKEIWIYIWYNMNLDVNLLKAVVAKQRGIVFISEHGWTS